MRPNISSGAMMVLAERLRQEYQERWTAEHDDGHKHAELAWAGACYAGNAAGKVQFNWKDELTQIPSAWPWAKKDWKPSADPIRDLVKAGALIAAEIDRLQRLQAKEKGGAK